MSDLLEGVIDEAFERRAEFSPASAPDAVRQAVASVLAGLDAGKLRVAEKRDGEWFTHQWIKKAVLMPSYVNVGAYVDEGTMVDTWATVGSCAQIGRNVHLSGGVGIGGVLEPLQEIGRAHV